MKSREKSIEGSEAISDFHLKDIHNLLFSRWKIQKEENKKEFDKISALNEEKIVKECTFKPKIHHRSHKSVSKSTLQPGLLVDSEKAFELYIKNFQNSDKNLISPDIWYKQNTENQLRLSAEKIEQKENSKSSVFSQLKIKSQGRWASKNKNSKSFKLIEPAESYFFDDYENIMLESKGCSKGTHCFFVFYISNYQFLVLATTESVSRIQDARIEKETKQTIKNKGINRKQASIIAKENTKVNSIPSYFEDISKISLNNSTVKLVSSK